MNELTPSADVREQLSAERDTLKVLAPYNGTVSGARAISECRERIEKLEAYLARLETRHTKGKL